MIYIREFEVYEEEGFFVADPLDMEGGRSARRSRTPSSPHATGCARPPWTPWREGGRLGGSPSHGGRVVAVSVDCDLARADAVTAAEASRMLGVSPARVSQMCESGRLTSWKDGGRRMVMRRSVEARIAENPGPGRPRRPEALEG